MKFFSCYNRNGDFMRICLIGGGNTRENENKNINKYIVNLANKEKPNIIYFALASKDSKDNIDAFINAFKDLANIRVFKDDFKESCSWADIIYFGGGNTSLIIDFINKNNLKDELVNVIRDKIYVGISAGAICLFDKYLSDQNVFNLGNGNFNFLLKDGLGIIKGYCCPHYNESGKEIFFDLIDEDNIGLAIDNNVCVSFDENGFSVVKDKKVNDAYFIYQNVLYSFSDEKNYALINNNFGKLIALK